ncbi:NADH-quinone oxidoreductase subunit NuoH [Pasteuria penetrans]|uniref:NADH-quinone oxidoreductase subunit NuoH n=1 Tax=Pasteuria penetrans TaxID=86005 RepID=UPI000FBF4156|nr:NADH-quinone oxidoreductase subunit NuoH [Pasteuria penetrans]
MIGDLLYAGILLAVVLLFVMLAVLAERKVIGWIQLRHGPNRVGPWGMLQTMADVGKLFCKEDIRPAQVDPRLFRWAPILAFLPSFAGLVVVPFMPQGMNVNLSAGLLYGVAWSSITTLAIIVAGWSSNNKYALIGAMRAAAQMISYEVPLLLALAGVALGAGSLQLDEIVRAQSYVWFLLPQVVGFAVFCVSLLAELHRTPFDFPEAESELVAGYHVEYSGFRFALFMLTEYVYVFSMAALATVLYLGGWDSPFGVGILPPALWFGLKMSSILFVIFWVRATWPRLRVDSLLPLAWKVLVPLALLNLLWVAVAKEIPVLRSFYGAGQ